MLRREYDKLPANARCAAPNSYAGMLVRMHDLQDACDYRSCAFSLQPDESNAAECSDILRDFNECYSVFVRTNIRHPPPTLT
jgi:hypothetical protein